MKNLGKKISIFLFLTTTIYAKVTAHVEPAVVYSGETAKYLLTISGGTVAKPNLANICGNDIIGTASQTNIEMVNNDYKKSYIFSYEFMPQKSCTIEPTTVEVDGRKEESNSVKVIVKPAAQNKNAPFVLSLKSSKKRVFIGEPFRVELEIKQNKAVSFVDSSFKAPDFKGFWVKGKPQVTKDEDSEYIITHISYKLAAQREGNLTIKPAQLRIAMRMNQPDMWGYFIPQVKQKSYYSNGVDICAKSLPHGVKIVGDFKITATVDKKEIAPNEALNVVVSVEGEGNLEDIGSFKPYIENVNVFDEKIIIKGEKLSQKLAFVSDRDFTIPPFTVTFYNLKTKKIETIKTEPVKIKVKGSIKKKEAIHIEKGSDNKIVLQSEEDVKKSKSKKEPTRIEWVWILFAFITGLFSGVLLMFVKKMKIKRVKKFNIKDEKLLLLKLLPYKEEDEEVQRVIEAIERRLYEGSMEKIDKKLLKKIVKRYNLTFF